jgi:hypothetical protein
MKAWHFLLVSALAVYLAVRPELTTLCYSYIITDGQTSTKKELHTWQPKLTDETMFILAKHAKLLVKQPRNHSMCIIQAFGSGNGAHTLCENYVPQGSCQFYSFGISRDYSFDIDVAEKWNCTGFAADPSVIHPSRLHELITFHNIGARMLAYPQDGRIDAAISTSLPSLKSFLNHSYIDVLKMDCEGCEYALARDIIFEDPNFFHHVGQFAVEIHTSKNWLHTKDAVYSLAKLFQLLDEAGLLLTDWAITPCSHHHEASGCMDEVIASGLPCGSGQSCHNYLFARAKRANSPNV